MPLFCLRGPSASATPQKQLLQRSRVARKSLRPTGSSQSCSDLTPQEPLGTFRKQTHLPPTLLASLFIFPVGLQHIIQTLNAGAPRGFILLFNLSSRGVLLKPCTSKCRLEEEAHSCISVIHLLPTSVVVVTAAQGTQTRSDLLAATVLFPTSL